MTYGAFSAKQRQVLTWWVPGNKCAGYDAIVCDGAVRSGKTIASLRRNVLSEILPKLEGLGAASEEKNLDEMKIGDVTLKRNSTDTASKCLYSQGELIIAPYLADRFCFRGV